MCSDNAILQNQYASIWLNYLALGFIKISILLFYRRLSVSFPKHFLYATYIGLAYNGLFIVSFAIVLCLICRPLDAYWLRFNLSWLVNPAHHPRCVDEGTLFSIAGILSCVGDFYTTTVPLCLIIYLSLPKSQKFALYALFACGYVIVIFGIVRTVILWRVFHDPKYDMSWLLWEYWVWNMLELFLAIIAASASANKPLVRRWLLDPIHRLAESRLSGTTVRGSTDRSKGSSNGRSGTMLGDLESGAGDGNDTYEIDGYGRVVPIRTATRGKETKAKSTMTSTTSSSTTSPEPFQPHPAVRVDTTRAHPHARTESLTKPSSPITPIVTYHLRGLGPASAPNH